MDARKRVWSSKNSAWLFVVNAAVTTVWRDATRRDVTATSPRGTGIARNSPRCRLIAVALQLRRRSVQQYYMYLWFQYHASQCQWLKWSCEAGGLTWRSQVGANPIPIPTQLLALFGHKITLYRFHQGGSYYCRGLKSEQGADLPPPSPLTLTTAQCEQKTQKLLLR